MCVSLGSICFSFFVFTHLVLNNIIFSCRRYSQKNPKMKTSHAHKTMIFVYFRIIMYRRCHHRIHTLTVHEKILPGLLAKYFSAYTVCAWRKCKKAPIWIWCVRLCIVCMSVVLYINSTSCKNSQITNFLISSNMFQKNSKEFYMRCYHYSLFCLVRHQYPRWNLYRYYIQGSVDMWY